ncbi:MAG: hypothetical protein HY314_14220 [Acidobacteria bacterium]|nr:hypothetical protein [Acidobacteriota bacterium]
MISALGETAVSLPELASDKNQLQLDFVGLSFAPGESLRYQYRLEGADADWSAPTDQRTVTYANLAPGAYRSLVRAINADGIVSPNPAVVTFTILRPIWQRWWFLMLAAIIVGAVSYPLYRYRVARLLELERVRTRIATDLHDDIGAGLSQIAILGEVLKQQNAVAHPASAHMLTQITDTARGLVDAMSDIVWSIDPRRDTLNNLILRVGRLAADLPDPKGIACHFQASPGVEAIKLTPEQRRHLFLIFKEALNNIVRHADCTSVSLVISVTDHHLSAEIQDNGYGFARTVADEDGDPPHRGHGLKNMQARAVELGGQFRIDSVPGGGTRLNLSVPLK